MDDDELSGKTALTLKIVGSVLTAIGIGGLLHVLVGFFVRAKLAADLVARR